MRHELRLTGLLSSAAVAVIACCSNLLAQEPRFALSKEQIAEAIAWGLTGRPEGYALRNSAAERIGTLYTPYLRVALAARFAAERNQPFSANDVSPKTIDPLFAKPSGEAIAYVAMRVGGAESPDDLPSFDVRLLHAPSNSATMKLMATSGSMSIGRGDRLAPGYLWYGLDARAVYVLTSFPQKQIWSASHVELFDRTHGRRWRDSTLAIIRESDVSEWR
jgi:hypothetical protein